MILIGLCVIKDINDCEKKIKQLEREKNYYMKMYAEFNEGMLEGMKVISERDLRKE